jgi:hypothetical protein
VSIAIAFVALIFFIGIYAIFKFDIIKLPIVNKVSPNLRGKKEIDIRIKNNIEMNKYNKVEPI